MAPILASDWSRAGGTSGDVTSGKSPLTSWKKGIVGSDKSRDVGKPLASVKKGSRAHKPLEKTRAQSPKSNFRNGGDPWSENTEKK